MPFADRPNINLSPRIKGAAILVVFLISLLVIRLWYLQILKGSYFRNLSENNRIRSVYIQAPRGLIFDRNGELWASNRPAFNVELIKEDCPDEKKVLAKIEEIVELPAGSLSLNSPLSRRRRPFEPRVIMKDVSREVVAKIEARKAELPGVVIEATPTRDYLQGELGAHVTGYIREITKDQLDDSKYAGYQQGELVGQFGLESHLEEMIHGVRGLKRIEVNAMGVRIGEFSSESERMGNDIHLTINSEMQRAAVEGLAGKKGAVVALDVNTGEILTMVSMPAYDPNIFTGEVKPDVWNDLINGRPSKLNNRVLQAAYPPGSVFKVITGLAGLSEKVVTPRDKVYCPGYYQFAGRNYRCHKKTGHGYVDFESALIQSCDVYYYSLATKLGIDVINSYATRLGLGAPSGLGLAHESRGLVPSTEWKRLYFKKPEDKVWYPGETLSVVIGQGATTTTPVQIAKMIAAIANGGKLLRPQLVREIRGGDNNLLQGFTPEVLSQIDLDPNILKLVRKALVGVVNDPRGTGGRSKLKKFPDRIVAGKTGTSQVVALEARLKHEDFEDHAWFAAYAPEEAPEVAVAVLVENGGHGGAAAAPVAGMVLEKYFESRSR
jgi:penicillin-binding protein 2